MKLNELLQSIGFAVVDLKETKDELSFQIHNTQLNKEVQSYRIIKKNIQPSEYVDVIMDIIETLDIYFMENIQQFQKELIEDIKNIVHGAYQKEMINHVATLNLENMITLYKIIKPDVVIDPDLLALANPETISIG